MFPISFYRLKWLLLLVLCGVSTLTATAAKEVETVRFWHFFGADDWPVWQGFIDEFNATHPHIEIVPEYQGSGAIVQRKLLAAIVAGVPPDVTAVFSTTIAKLAATGWLVPIDLSDADKLDVYPAIQRAYTYDEKLWALPIEGSAYSLFYNTELFEDAGLTRPPQTLDELIEWGKKLTKDLNGDGRPDQWGFLQETLEGGPTRIFNWYFSNGVEFISEDGLRATFDGPEMKEVLTYWRDLATVHRIASLTPPTKAVQRGLVGMWIDGSWKLREYRGAGMPFATAVMPPFKVLAIESGPDAAVVARSNPEREAAALEFVLWLTSTETFTDVCIKLGYLPNRKSVTESPRYQSYLQDHPELEAFVKTVPYTRTKPLHPIWNEVEAQIHRSREFVAQGTKTVDQALADAQMVAQTALDQYSASEARRHGAKGLPTFWVLAAIAALGIGGYLVWQRQKQMTSKQAIQWAGYLFILPQLLLFVSFDVFPIAFAFLMSFFDWDMLSRPVFAGLMNYQTALADTNLHSAFTVTLYWVIGTVPLGTAISLSAALLLNNKLKGISAYRTLFYTPTVTSGVALGIVWWWILSPSHSGLFNAVLGAVDINPVGWLTDPTWAMPGLIVMELWRSLAKFIIFLAGLQGVPAELYEASEIDGAGPGRRFRHVTWPLLMPTTFFVVVTSMIGAFQVFEQVYVMTQGGPAGATTTTSYYLFQNGFEFFKMGYASSIAYLLAAIILIATFIQKKYLGQDVSYS